MGEVDGEALSGHNDSEYADSVTRDLTYLRSFLIFKQLEPPPSYNSIFDIVQGIRPYSISAPPARTLVFLYLRHTFC